MFFKIVRQNTVCFLEQLGKLKRPLNPGLNFYIPFISKVVGPVKLREQTMLFDHQKVITKDNVEIDINGIFFFKIRDPQKAVYSVEDYTAALDDLSMSISRSEIGKTTLDDIIQHRKTLNESIRAVLNRSTSDWGIDCLNYEVLKIEPPQKIKDALKFVAEAERLRRRDVILSEAERSYQVAIAEAEKIAKIIREEGKAEGVKIEAEEFAGGVAELNSRLKGRKDEQSLIEFLLLENYIKKYGDVLRESGSIVLPEGADGKVDGGLVSLAYIMKMAGKGDMLAREQRLPSDNIVYETKEEKKQEDKDKDIDNEEEEEEKQVGDFKLKEFFEEISNQNHRK